MVYVIVALQRASKILMTTTTLTNPDLKNQRAFQLSLLVVAIATVIFLSAIYTLHVVSGSQTDAMMQRLRFKTEHVERQIALQNEKRSQGGGEYSFSRESSSLGSGTGNPILDLAQLSDPSSETFRAARDISARYNTRYWLETKPYWPKSPLPEREKYITFEPWPGGFNNIRMSLEMAAALAVAMDRTLVLPPKYHMYLRGTSDFQDYFDYNDMQKGISTITYLEFRARVRLGDFDAYGAAGPQDKLPMKEYFAGLAKMPKNKVAIQDKTKWKQKIASEIVFCFPTCPRRDR